MRLLNKLVEPISVIICVNFTEFMDYIPVISDGISSFLGLIASIWGTYKAIKEVKENHKNKKQNGKLTEI
jgi:hypothetical protein